MDFWHSKSALNELTTQGNKPSNRTSSTSLTVATNRNKCVEYLRATRDKAASKYVNKAYLHWFTKFGIESDMFEKAFQNAQLVIDTYDEMSG